MVTVGVGPLALLALAVAAAGVIGSFVPLLPGAVLSLGGVYLYWFATGYTEPGLLVLIGLTVVGLATVAVDWLGGAVAAKAGGASTRLAAAAGVVGLVGLVLAGPVGLFVGVAGTVFAVEYATGGDRDASLRAAAYTTVGLLATSVLQAVLTLSIFVGLVAVAVF